MGPIRAAWLEWAWNKTHHLFASRFFAPQTAHFKASILRASLSVERSPTQPFLVKSLLIAAMTISCAYA
jgi:hypothetical protein